jgi:hypothetical protein
VTLSPSPWEDNKRPLCVFEFLKLVFETFARPVPKITLFVEAKHFSCEKSEEKNHAPVANTRTTAAAAASRQRPTHHLD